MPDSQPPTAAGLCPERPDWFDIPGQRDRLPSLALGRDIPSRRYYCAVRWRGWSLRR